ncbi:SseB family protein, partial [Subtercola sp. RTI3]|uniref:SseB family protein n=1 Tax=Subtercola sp. RTI3 TaxID=3048639 RepID=UPI002B237833
MAHGHPESSQGDSTRDPSASPPTDATNRSSTDPAAAFAGDSAGQPWAGRHFDTNSFAGDDGRAPEQLIEALTLFRAGEASQADVLDAVRDARLLVPLVAHAGETDTDSHGRTIDKTQELSIVTVQAPDGRTALPAFTSTAAMAAWNPKARPIPTAARRVALAAAGESTDLMILDPTSATEFAVRRPALWALAQGTEWHVPFDDPAVVAEFAASVAGESAVASLALSLIHI